jgi:hypothetical protein
MVYHKYLCAEVNAALASSQANVELPRKPGFILLDCNDHEHLRSEPSYSRMKETMVLSVRCKTLLCHT